MPRPGMPCPYATAPEIDGQSLARTGSNDSTRRGTAAIEHSRKRGPAMVGDAPRSCSSPVPPRGSAAPAPGISRGAVSGLRDAAPARRGDAPAGRRMIAMDVDDDASVADGHRRGDERAGRLDAVSTTPARRSPARSRIPPSPRPARNSDQFLRRAARLPRRAADDAAAGRGTHRQHQLARRRARPAVQRPLQRQQVCPRGDEREPALEARRFGIKVVLIQPGDFRTVSPAAGARRRRRRPPTLRTRPLRHVQGAAGQGRGAARRPAAGRPPGRARPATPSPRLRYSVGMLGQRIVVPLKRLLPQRLFELLLVLALGL